MLTIVLIVVGVVLLGLFIFFSQRYLSAAKKKATAKKKEEIEALKAKAEEMASDVNGSNTYVSPVILNNKEFWDEFYSKYPKVEVAKKKEDEDESFEVIEMDKIDKEDPFSDDDFKKELENMSPEMKALIFSEILKSKN